MKKAKVMQKRMTVVLGGVGDGGDFSEEITFEIRV